MTSVARKLTLPDRPLGVAVAHTSVLVGLEAHAISVEVIGEYETKDKALADARANCSGS